MEQEAFLADEEPRLSQDQDQDQDCVQSRTLSTDRTDSFYWYFCSIFVLKFCIQFNTALLELPFLRLVEKKLCRTYAGVHVYNDSEAACKTPVVQDNLAYVVGYKSTFDALPCLLTALIYGSISNKCGRRLVMVLSVTGQILAMAWVTGICFTDNEMPVELIWLASLFLLIGGGIRLELSMQYTSFCDMVPWDQRTKMLSLFHTADGIAGFLGYPAGAALMKHRLWYPFAVALAIYLLRLVLLYHIQETSPYLNARPAEHSIALASQKSSNSDEDMITSSAQASSHLSNRSSLQCWYFSSSYAYISRLRTFLGYKGLGIIFICFLFKRIGFMSESFAFQYGSEILQKKLSETFWLRVFSHLGMTLALGVLVPLLTQKLTSPMRDIWVLRASLFDLIVGFMMLWSGHTLSTLCVGLALCGLGEGLEVSLQCLGSYIVGKINYGIFFSFASILGVFGELVGGPIVAWAYSIRDEDRLPIGYCFLLSTIIFSGLLISSYFIKADQLRIEKLSKLDQQANSHIGTVFRHRECGVRSA